MTLEETRNRMLELYRRVIELSPSKETEFDLLTREASTLEKDVAFVAEELHISEDQAKELLEYSMRITITKLEEILSCSNVENQ